MATLTVRQILLFFFVVGFISLVISIATDTYNFDSYASSRQKAYGAFQIIGAISLGLVIVLEAMSAFSDSMRSNRMMHSASIAFMVLAGISTIIACSIYSAYHFPYGWTVAACTLTMEALLIFIVTHVWIH